MLANVERRSWILLALPVFWCLALGDEPTIHEPEAVPEMPARREAALPLTDPPVVSMNSCTRASEVRLSPLALARRRVCEALPGRPRAGRLRARYALKKGRRELVTVVGFVAVLAVWRLGARPQTADTACWPKAGEKKGRERSATEGRRKV